MNCVIECSLNQPRIQLHTDVSQMSPQVKQSRSEKLKKRNKYTRKENSEANVTQNIPNIFFSWLLRIYSKKKAGNWKRLTSTMEAEFQHR